MLILPAIDLRGGRCVRLLQGRKEDVTIYGEDPVQMAQTFADAGAQMLHVVNLDGAFGETESPNARVASAIFRAVKIPVQFGGGMRSLADVRHVLEAGAERVVVGTLAAESPALLAEMVAAFPARIVVGIDARGGQVLTRGWEESSALSALELAQKIRAAGVERVVYTDVARDGMLTGVNHAETRALARASGLRVTASGGIATLADLEILREAEADGVDSVIIGKALYERRFTLAEALRVAGN